MSFAAAMAGGQAVLGAASAITEGAYQAAVARNNARLAEANADRESYAGQTEAMRLSQENAGRLAEMTAQQAGSGLAVSSSSFEKMRALEMRIGATEVRDTARVGGERAQASLQQAANFRGEARAAKRNAVFGALGSFMGGAGQIAGSGGAKSSLIDRSKLNKRFG